MGCGKQAYAASFFAIPAIRWFFNRRRNNAIEARNQARLDALGKLSSPSLRAKLAAAGKLAERVVIQDRDLIYSSDRWPIPGSDTVYPLAHAPKTGNSSMQSTAL